ncbi:unnamed protein product [Cercopithifilaria johnstoni]|uniref:Glycine-rich protein n=1 Tax=Cercopithifilaria johnstoni TaxID=2874296 RepID=A0A8J2MJH9_9BILA|nr:unnamed protein product [Cercopithifilaria johnstoni]
MLMLFFLVQIIYCSVSSYGIGSGPGGSGSWSTRGVGGISGDSYQQSNGIFGSHRQQERYDSYPSGGGLFGGASCSCSSGYGGLFGKK